VNEIQHLLQEFDQVSVATEELCVPLVIDDYTIQSIPDVSPPKWHLGHTAWFFEQLILRESRRDYEAYHPKFHYIFNSYYESLGDRIERSRRGLLSRPSVEEIYLYRQHVRANVHEIFGMSDCQAIERLSPTLLLGIHHEQQHQELLLGDILHNFWTNPLRPAYSKETPRERPETPPKWIEIEGGLKKIGDSGTGFSFDNERPRHSVFLEDYKIRSQPVTEDEFLEFVEDGGYRKPNLWLSDAWKSLQVLPEELRRPLYWEKQEGQWWRMTLGGMRRVQGMFPMTHLNYYEADAFARWRGCRLPSECEWETASERMNWGEVWEWTSSAYQPYPGFCPYEGPASEYNGKFMCNQMVLRGGSSMTPRSHIRSTYRNFYPPGSAVQFSGARLAS
jgi:ergothioneine biosynthesis protein EgtB